MATTITVSGCVHVARPPEFVWDYTQDFSRRRSWDSSVLEATVVSSAPAPVVKIRGVGGLRALLRYRQFDRPKRTSLVLEVEASLLVNGGGGSWSYEPSGAGTTWTQSNTLILKPGVLGRLATPIVRWMLRSSTCAAMRKAKHLMESSA